MISRGTKKLTSCMSVCNIRFTRFISNKPTNLRFDGQTAIITGGGRGLGRDYALLFASRGANVIVNDFGGSSSGETAESKEQNVADQVVDEIRKLHPTSKAIANHESISVEDGVRRLTESAMDNFGRIDILINNAGILRDKSFAKMTVDDWDQTCDTHLRGSFLMTHACWPIMRKNNYGKIIMTSSVSGLYGNFGQANYSAAKMALVGLCNTLAIEGSKNNIYCNTIVPMARSRMTEKTILPEDLHEMLHPSNVAPIVAWLCHKDCQVNGSVIEAAGRWYGQYKLYRSGGKYFPIIGSDSVEKIRDNWHEITTFDDGRVLPADSFTNFLQKLFDVFKSQKA